MVDVRAVQTRNWSLMPEGLETGLAVQDMADLLVLEVRFLESYNHSRIFSWYLL